MQEMDKLEVIKDKYADIINLEHHVSQSYKQMSVENRAGQFAPFAALTGYGEAVKEKSRITDKKIEMSEELIYDLNLKLQKIANNILSLPQVEVTYFVSDNKKSGGHYVTTIDNVKRIDDVNKKIHFVKMSLKISDILNLEIM